MSDTISCRNGVKAKKKYRCDLCGERINAGEVHDVRTGIEDGWWTMRMHVECHEHEMKPDTVDPEWYEDISFPAFERPKTITTNSNPNEEQPSIPGTPSSTQ